jgi:GntR family transcriptional repressor for pyruvate dehydrogenase complex
VRWQPVSRRRTYELVLERLEEQIVEGELKVGDRLPPERDLAAMLGVSRSAVREAMRALEARGAVRSEVGTGADSGTTVTASSGDALSRLVRLHVALASFPLEDLVEARVMMERWSVGLAANNATQTQLARIAELVATPADPQSGPVAFQQLDAAFHVAIAEASGNRMIRDFTAAIVASLADGSSSSNVAGDWGEPVTEVLAEHRTIVEYLVARDATAAVDMMEKHIRRLEDGEWARSAAG